ncbi:MAG: YfhO family protein, partial [[Clostridium] leptum]
FEMGMNGGNLVDSLDSQFGYEDRSTYTENYNRKEALVQQACRLDSGWYRLEDKTRRNANDAFSLGYHGLAHYSSFTNRNMSSFLSRLGVSARVQGRFLRYSGSSNVIDSLLGIRYVIGRRAPHQDYVPAAEIDGFRLYENPDALPAAFLSSTDLGGFHIAQDENVFEAQNHLMSALLGEEKEYFTAVDGVEMTPSRYAYPGQWFSDGWCTVTKMEGEEAYLEFSLVNDKDQEIYFYMTSSGFADNNYLFLDGRILEDEKHPLTGAVDLGWFEEGETIKVQMYLNGDLTYLQMPLFYGFDAEAFHQDCDALKARGMTEITQDLTGLSGTVEVEEGEAVLFTSLPADPGWTVWVDGEQTPWNTVSDAFLTVRLSKGSHRVSFTFCPAGLREGLLITAASGAVGILGVFWFRFLRSRVKSNGRR